MNFNGILSHRILHQKILKYPYEEVKKIVANLDQMNKMMNLEKNPNYKKMFGNSPNTISFNERIKLLNI